MPDPASCLGAHATAGNHHVPVLRLSDLWLEQLGFAIGSKVRITVRTGEVVVSVVEGDAGSTQT
ncbi:MULTISPECIES: SymE family type I addiction module toxin [unclassified Pseudomonas]|uniref:SymE family type I addiction module toxin n=1 Tax=unclassified Pseudomonas TaxID=196821 RepID=UPI000AAE7E04|nr:MULTISPECIES: SymE family type I addiction module toxin [unclassified Pseudomonas]